MSLNPFIQPSAVVFTTLCNRITDLSDKILDFTFTHSPAIVIITAYWIITSRPAQQSDCSVLRTISDCSDWFTQMKAAL